MNSPNNLNLDAEKILLEQLKQGDEDAYFKIFEGNWERLYSIAKRILNDSEAAKDIVQEVFLNLWEKREERNIKNLEHYLARAVKFASLNVIRNNHFKHAEEISQDINLVSVNNELEYKEFESNVNLVIASLPERCKEVFLLSREEELTNSEIAKNLNLSQRTVETHISNALKHLRKNLPKDTAIAVFMGLFI